MVNTFLMVKGKKAKHEKQTQNFKILFTKLFRCTESKNGATTFV